MGREGLRAPWLLWSVAVVWFQELLMELGWHVGDFFQWARESRSLMICLCMQSTAYYTRAAQEKLCRAAW